MTDPLRDALATLRDDFGWMPEHAEARCQAALEVLEAALAAVPAAREAEPDEQGIRRTQQLLARGWPQPAAERVASLEAKLRAREAAPPTIDQLARVIDEAQLVATGHGIDATPHDLARALLADPSLPWAAARERDDQAGEAVCPECGHHTLTRRPSGIVGCSSCGWGVTPGIDGPAGPAPTTPDTTQQEDRT